MKLTRLTQGAIALALAASMSGCAGLLHRAAAPEAEQASAATATFPQPVRVKLSNGLTLLVIERHNLPIVSVSTVVRAGDAIDPSGKAGLASLTADMLKRGTTTRSAPQIAQAIEFVGGSLSADAGLDSSSVGLSVLKKDLNVGLDLLADVLTRPAFPADELARLKEESRAGLTSLLDDPSSVAQRALQQTLLKGHPYGEGSPTLSSLDHITRADIQRFYDTYYRPNNAFMAVVGDITPAEAKSRFEQALKGWKAKPVQAPTIKAPTAPAGRSVVLVDMPVNQSFIRLGHLGVQRNTPDYFPLQVMNFILGGDFTSRLNQEIRDRQGLAYGAHSAFGMFQHGGIFYASVNTKNASTGQAIRSLINELRTMQEQGLSEEELAYAKKYLTGAFPLRFETNADLAREVVNMELYGLPADFLSTYSDKVRAVSREDVQRVARQYLHPDAYDMVVVTKAADMANTLKEFGTLSVQKKEQLIR